MSRPSEADDMETMKEMREHLPPEVLALPEEQQMEFLQHLLQQFRVSWRYNVDCLLSYTMGGSKGTPVNSRFFWFFLVFSQHCPPHMRMERHVYTQPRNTVFSLLCASQPGTPALMAPVADLPVPGGGLP